MRFEFEPRGLDLASKGVEEKTERIFPNVWKHRSATSNGKMNINAQTPTEKAKSPIGNNNDDDDIGSL